MNETLLTSEKSDLRAAMTARRKAANLPHSEAVLQARLGNLLTAYRGRVLSGYLPMRSEPDPRPALLAQGGPWCMPVIEGKGMALRFRDWNPECTLEPGPYGALVPAEGPWREPAVLVVPMLAFDRGAFRLGYGGGFYDRTLAELRARGPVVAIGLAFAAQEVTSVPRNATDAPLDMVVTEVETLILR